MLHVQNVLLIRCIVVVFLPFSSLILLDFILQRAREAFLPFLLGLYLSTGTLHILR